MGIKRTCFFIRSWDHRGERVFVCATEALSYLLYNQKRSCDGFNVGMGGRSGHIDLHHYAAVVFVWDGGVLRVCEWSRLLIGQGNHFISAGRGKGCRRRQKAPAVDCARVQRSQQLQVLSEPQSHIPSWIRQGNEHQTAPPVTPYAQSGNVCPAGQKQVMEENTYWELWLKHTLL